MRVIVAQDKRESGQKAAAHGARLIGETLAEKGTANIILATGASQFEMLEATSGQRSGLGT